jgi:enamine deaminase RidA (YjgF/YER057c/UK114 family)
MRPGDVAKVGVYVTDRALVPLWRAARERFFGSHAPASTLLIVAGLINPCPLIEVEIEAAH